MAQRASGKKKAAKKKVAGGRLVSRGKVAALPKKVGVGHNSGAVPDEVIVRNIKSMNAKWADVEKAKLAYDQAKGVYQNARKVAKKDGVNVDGYDIMRRLEKEDMGHVQINHADAARYMRLTDSPLLQLNLFDGMAIPEPKVDAHLQGRNAGKGGESAENNPHTPGSEEFQLWADGWVAGQEDLAKGIGATGTTH